MRNDITFWTSQRIFMAADMWKSGAKMPAIRKALGCTNGMLSGVMSRYRDIFERRQSISQKKIVPPPVHRLSHTRLSDGIETVVRVTALGAKVTMPRVSFIDGRALQAKEG